MKPGKFVNDIKRLKKDTDIWVVGKLEKGKLAPFIKLGANSLEVVLTGERRKHYLKVKGRKEIEKLEGDIPKIIKYPKRIYKNGRHKDTVWFLGNLDEAHFLKLVVKLTRDEGEQKHSILTFHPIRKQRLKKFKKNLIWEVNRT